MIFVIANAWQKTRHFDWKSFDNCAVMTFNWVWLLTITQLSFQLLLFSIALHVNPNFCSSICFFYCILIRILKVYVCTGYYFSLCLLWTKAWTQKNFDFCLWQNFIYFEDFWKTFYEVSAPCLESSMNEIFDGKLTSYE